MLLLPEFMQEDHMVAVICINIFSGIIHGILLFFEKQCITIGFETYIENSKV